MKPPLKLRRRPAPPQITRRQLDELVGKAVTDFLLREPSRTHYTEITAQALIEEVLELLAQQPYY